jgi:hypothetical protein
MAYGNPRFAEYPLRLDPVRYAIAFVMRAQRNGAVRCADPDGYWIEILGPKQLGL